MGAACHPNESAWYSVTRQDVVYSLLGGLPAAIGLLGYLSHSSLFSVTFFLTPLYYARGGFLYCSLGSQLTGLVAE